MTTLSSSETNWTVSRGSLDSTVTFESFDFPIDSESPVRKPSLLLVPPSSSDFEPCEIKINFTQKHEIRQVYVRSTARVYEIYYAPALQGDNEYLCTVRCSAVSVEDNSCPENDVKEADWVEVKLPAGGVHEGDAYLPNPMPNNSRSYQDYYEATAEINDSEPCMSLTLRLLSLQSKGCVYIDEVYVFADPIDTSDSENQTVNTETSATNSSLMTMLVPTLLGLTKSRSLQLQNQNISNPIKIPIKTEPEPVTSTNPVNQKDYTLLKSSETKAELKSQLPVSILDKDKDKLGDLTMRNDFSCTRTEILLEQLVSRVSRIEDICMGFEEKMLKPINNIEARLQRVEQQVELLGKNSFSCPVSHSFSRFETNPRSIRNEEKDSPLCGKSESSNEVSDVLESPCCDVKEEVNHVLESPKKEIPPKKAVSVDDAMAAALAGFSSFTKTSNGFTVLPLESPDEKCLKSNQVSTDETDGVTVLPFESPEQECLKSNQVSIDETNDDVMFLPLESPEEECLKSNQVSTDETDDGVMFLPLESSEEECLKSSQVSTDRSLELDSDGEASILSESMKAPAPEFTAEENDEVTNSCDVSSYILGDNSLQTHDGECVQQESIKAVKILTFDKNDILKHFPDQPPDASESRINFETPILDVKFASLENGNLEPPLEALLSNTDDGVPDKGVLIENKTSSTASNLLVDLGGDDDGEGMQQDLPPAQMETSFPSLI